jgi:hypothetical protein
VFAESLTDVTLQLYSAVLEKLPPTPSRFHYVFNLRDLSRVYEGLLRSTADTVREPADFLRLWRNEVRTYLCACQPARCSTAGECTVLAAAVSCGCQLTGTPVCPHVVALTVAACVP